VKYKKLSPHMYLRHSAGEGHEETQRKRKSIGVNVIPQQHTIEDEKWRPFYPEVSISLICQ